MAPPLRFESLVPAALVVAGLGALAAAFTAQYGFGLQPCILCYWQRVPYALVAVLGGLALLPAARPPLRARLVLVCALAFLVNTGIAIYHVGVEQHLWTGTAACAGTGLANLAGQDLKALMSQPMEGHCDQPNWYLFGITMAGYNIAASLILGVATLWAAARLRRDAGP